MDLFGLHGPIGFPRLESFFPLKSAPKCNNKFFSVALGIKCYTGYTNSKVSLLNKASRSEKTCEANVFQCKNETTHSKLNRIKSCLDKFIQYSLNRPLDHESGLRYHN